MKNNFQLLTIGLPFLLNNGCAGQQEFDLERASIQYVIENIDDMRIQDYSSDMIVFVASEVTSIEKDKFINEGMSKMLGLFEYVWPDDTLNRSGVQYSKKELRKSENELSHLPSVNDHPDQSALLTVNNRILYKDAYYVVVRTQVKPSHYTCYIYLKYNMGGKLLTTKTTCSIE